MPLMAGNRSYQAVGLLAKALAAKGKGRSHYKIPTPSSKVIEVPRTLRTPCCKNVWGYATWVGSKAEVVLPANPASNLFPSSYITALQHILRHSTASFRKRLCK